MDTCKRRVTGARSRAAGASFESMIEAGARFYEEKGIAVIDKTPEPMKVLKPYNRQYGQFVACFSKQAQPDYKGILMDSTMILFDAKHTEKDRISRDVITDEQEKCFERYKKLGAMCFVVASIGFQRFYRIPWEVFRDMKIIFGHKFMNESDLEEYEIGYSGGVLRFLDGITLKGDTENDSKTN